MQRTIRRILFGAMVIAIVLGVLAIQPPSQSTDSAVVFSNMQGDIYGPSIGVNYKTSGVLIFDVPTGSDYQINYVQVFFQGLYPDGSYFASIHADDAGDMGPVVVDLGEVVISNVLSILTYRPSGTAVLPNGGRYWLVLRNNTSGGNWIGPNPQIPPTGVFTFVDAGNYQEPSGPYNSLAEIHSVKIDADPVGAVLLNDEPYRTTAVYCEAGGGFDVYGITDGAGWFAFRITQEEIDAVGIPAENTLLKQTEDGKIRLYRLTTGEFQVNAPRWDAIHGEIRDGYVFIWEPDSCE